MVSKDSIFERQAKAEKRIKALEEGLRKTTGNGRQVGKLTREVQDLKSRLTGSGPNPGVIETLEKLEREVEGLGTAVKAAYLQVAEHGDVLRDHEGRISGIENGRVRVLHELGLNDRTRWGEVVLWACVGGLLGWLIFVVLLGMKYGWVAAAVCWGIGFFAAAHFLQKLEPWGQFEGSIEPAKPSPSPKPEAPTQVLPSAVVIDADSTKAGSG